MACKKPRKGKVSTFKQGVARMKSKIDLLPERVQAARDIVGQEGVAIVQSQWPVDTGASKAAWRWTGESIINPLRYVPYVWAQKGTGPKIPGTKAVTITERGRRGYAFRLVPMVLKSLAPRFEEELQKQYDAAQQAAGGGS